MRKPIVLIMILLCGGIAVADDKSDADGDTARRLALAQQHLAERQAAATRPENMQAQANALQAKVDALQAKVAALTAEVTKLTKENETLKKQAAANGVSKITEKKGEVKIAKGMTRDEMISALKAGGGKLATDTTDADGSEHILWHLNFDSLGLGKDYMNILLDDGKVSDFTTTVSDD